MFLIISFSINVMISIFQKCLKYKWIIYFLSNVVSIIVKMHDCNIVKNK